MGEINGKPISTKNGHYFQQQIQVYRWRADPAFNLHIPRVRFFSKRTILQRSQFQNLLSDHLNTYNYVDVSSISRAQQQNYCGEQQEIMTFQPFAATLEVFADWLSLEESLYVLQALLSGYQAIFIKLRGCFVATDCCFVNEKGEVRAWVNANYTLNQFSENQSENCEATAVNRILHLCAGLNSRQAAFLQFSQQLRLFFERDVLQNLCFSAARRFINGYLFTHKLILPSDLSHPLKNLQERQHRRLMSKESSLSQLLQPPLNSSSYLFTKDNLVNRPPSRSQYSSSGSSSCLSQNYQHSQHPKLRQIEFYRPNQAAMRNSSNLELKMRHCASSVDKSQLLKRSVQQSISRNFTKKANTPACQFTFTPKIAVRSRPHLYSTAAQSFLRNTKDTSGLFISNIAESKSTAHLLQQSQNRPRLEKRVKFQPLEFALQDSNKDSRKIQKMQTQAHSKHPSFDENSSSQFLSPTSEHADRHYSRPIRSKIDTVSQSQQPEQDESQIGQDMSTIGQAPARQVSGLVQNQDLLICESKGSFLSIENNSCASEYRGELLRLGRSAKMVAWPSNKRMEGYVRSNIEPHFTR